MGSIMASMADRKSEGIEATNQAFVRYDQVNKKQEYHLAEGRHQEAFDDETRIQTCDIGRFLHGTDEDRTDFAREVAWLGQPGILSHQGDQRHPSRSGGGLGLLPPRLRSGRRCRFPLAGLLA